MNKLLCFGDSNTWGLNPSTKERYPVGIRWTGRIQNKLNRNNITVLEEGLCGRTTVYEDETRPGRKGIDSIKEILEHNSEIDAVVLMLGTNDCKTYNKSTAKSIAEGIDSCLEIVLEHVPAENVLLLSPIQLGERVWEDGYDTEFDENSVELSKKLKGEYAIVAKKRGVHFLSASDYARPSGKDREHLSAVGHKRLAEVIYNEIIKMNRYRATA